MLVANLETIECLGWSDKHKMTWDELQSVKITWAKQDKTNIPNIWSVHK